jgi:CspA family cold shock protein
MSTGTVKWFNMQKGYGFIAPENGGADVFVHITAVEKAGFRTLNENEKIAYDLLSEKGKTSAGNLRKALTGNPRCFAGIFIVRLNKKID